MRNASRDYDNLWVNANVGPISSSPRLVHDTVFAHGSNMLSSATATPKDNAALNHSAHLTNGPTAAMTRRRTMSSGIKEICKAPARD